MLSSIKSTVAIVFIALFLLWNSVNEFRWNIWGVMVWDVACYYGYLTKAFNNKTDELTPEEIQNPGLAPPNKYVIAPNGNKVLKTTMGMAVLYLPFYAAGHLAHQLLHGTAGSGMEVEYRIAMQFSGTCYLLLGLLLLRRLLRKYFEDGVTAATLFFIVLGTNALYYTTYEGCMSHAHNFFMFTLFMFLAERWLHKPAVPISVVLGLCVGLLTLIRPTNILIAVFLLLYQVYSLQTLKTRVALLVSKWPLLLLAAALSVVVWVPQFIYWHNTAGQYFFFSYIGERFFFDRPRIFLGMLGGRRGWLLYTPLGFFMLAGFFVLYKRAKDVFYPVLLFYGLHVWVIFSWWCWWYGGSFSCRPMVEAYAVLAFPLAALLTTVYHAKSVAVKATVTLLLLALTALNLFQTYQYKKGYIHYANMNYTAYRKSFLKTTPIPDSILTEPPWGAASAGEYGE